MIKIDGQTAAQPLCHLKVRTALNSDDLTAKLFSVASAVLVPGQPDQDVICKLLRFAGKLASPA